MSIKRWFDLTNEGAKLDRKISETGSAYLELTFSNADAMEDRLAAGRIEAVALNGWVKPEDGLSIRHYGEFRDFTEIARSLAVVFDDDAVSKAIAPRDELRQGEVLEGVDRPIYVGKEHIDQSMKHLPDAIRARALDMIEKARERQISFKGASLGATGGKLWELAERVSASLSDGMSTHFAKIAAVRYDDETIAQIERLTGIDTDAARNELEDVLRRIDLDGYQLREARKNALALGYSPETVEAVAAAEYIQSLPDARDLVLDLDRPQAVSAPLSEGFRREVHGFRFEVSADTTTLAAREYQARLSSAISFVADTFGMEPSEVFPANTRIRVVQGMANQSMRGAQYSQTRTGKDTAGDEFVDQSNAIVFAQSTVGTALHEIAHGLSRRLGDDPVKYDEIIHGSGLMEAMDGTLAEGKMRGLRSLDDEKYVAYLRDPEEVFARLVENALRTRCLEMHGNLDRLGGHAVAGHHINYAPLDADVKDRTIQVVRNFGAARGVMTELSVELPDEAVEQQRHAPGRMSMRGR